MEPSKQFPILQELTPEGDISKITRFIYLGSIAAAMSERTLRQHDIRRVFSVISNAEAIPPERQVNNVTYKHMPKNDLPGEDLLLSFEEATEYIRKSEEACESVLLHCQMGISRSATMVLAYLMRTNNWSFEVAFQFLQSRRSVVNPNYGFRAQLKLWHRMGCRLDANNKEFRLYLFNVVAFRQYLQGQFHINLREYLKKLEEIERSTKLVVHFAYKCTKCSHSVFTDLNILQASDQVQTTEECKYYLIEPNAWMLQTRAKQYIFSEFPGSSAGAIPCPHCNSLIGKFIFLAFQGPLCTCQEHSAIKSFLALEIHRNAVFKKPLKKQSFLASLFGTY